MDGPTDKAGCRVACTRVEIPLLPAHLFRLFFYHLSTFHVLISCTKLPLLLKDISHSIYTVRQTRITRELKRMSLTRESISTSNRIREKARFGSSSRKKDLKAKAMQNANYAENNSVVQVGQRVRWRITSKRHTTL